MFSYASCDSTLEWASSDTTSVCWQSWKACLMHQAKYAADSQVLCDRNFNVACETGIRYPTLSAMLNRDAMLIRISVRFIPCYPRLYHVILSYPILHMGYLD